MRFLLLFLIGATLSAQATGSADLSVTSFQSTSDQLIISGAVKPVYRDKYLLLKADLEDTHGTSRKLGASTSTLVTDVRSYQFQPSYEFSHGFSIYVEGTYYHNYALGINQELVYALGASYTLKSGWEVQADLRTISETFMSPYGELHCMGARFETSKTWLVKDTIISFSVDVVPAFGHANALQGTGFVKIARPITGRIMVSLTFGDDYCRNVTGTHDPNYYKTLFGLGYRW